MVRVNVKGSGKDDGDIGESGLPKHAGDNLASEKSIIKKWVTVQEGGGRTTVLKN